ncbi:hypothetical protein AYP95_00755 [Lactobacillus crispatus]|nr:hypothetical protein AYP95_00755 [Lactobacillus crispatus]
MMRRKASGNREQQRFSLRKVSGHLTSVLIGVTIFGGLMLETPKVHAEVNQSASASDANAITSPASAVTSTTDDQATSSASDANAITSPASAVTSTTDDQATSSASDANAITSPASAVTSTTDDQATSSANTSATSATKSALKDVEHETTTTTPDFSHPTTTSTSTAVHTRTKRSLAMKLVSITEDTHMPAAKGNKAEIYTGVNTPASVPNDKVKVTVKVTIKGYQNHTFSFDDPLTYEMRAVSDSDPLVLKAGGYSTPWPSTFYILSPKSDKTYSQIVLGQDIRLINSNINSDYRAYVTNVTYENDTDINNGVKFITIEVAKKPKLTEAAHAGYVFRKGDPVDNTATNYISNNKELPATVVMTTPFDTSVAGDRQATVTENYPGGENSWETDYVVPERLTIQYQVTDAKALWDKMQEVGQSDAFKYASADKKAEYQELLTKAKNVYENHQSTQKEINNALQALTDNEKSLDGLANNAIDQAAQKKDAAIDASNLTAEEKDALKKQVSDEVKTAKAAIDGATKDADVESAKNTGVETINNMPTTSATKSAAKDAIDQAAKTKDAQM